MLKDKINYLKAAKIQEEKELNELDNMIQLVRNFLEITYNRAKKSRSLIVCIK